MRFRREVHDDRPIARRAVPPRRVADVAVHERVPRVVHHVVQVFPAPRVRQLVERGDVPVGMRRASAWRTKLLPMNPAPPVTRTSTILARPVVRQRAVRFEPELVGILIVIGLGRNVQHHGHSVLMHFQP